MQYDEGFVRSSGDNWTDAKIAEEIEDIGFDAEIVEQSEVDDVHLRIYGWVKCTAFQSRTDAMLQARRR